MKYTKYFAQINSETGLQRISRSQLGRVMNIVFLEGQLKAIDQSFKKDPQNVHSRGVHLLQFKVCKRLTELTGNRQPNALMEEIYYISEREH